ncbi:MAG: ABC transporter permease, partial [Dongiaceae bacterium]
MGERSRRRRTLIEHALLIGPLPIALLLLYVVPFLGIAAWSVTLPEPGLENYARLAEDGPALAVILRTLRICLITTGISLILGYFLAYSWVFGSQRIRWFIEIGILVPFWISVLVRTFGWLVILGREGIVNGALMGIGLIDEPLSLVRNEIGVIVGMVHFMVPFAVLPIASSLRQMDRRLTMA